MKEFAGASAGQRFREVADCSSLPATWPGALRRHWRPRVRATPAANMNAAVPQPASDTERLEISLSSASELCSLGLGTMIDIRQSFEIELKGAIPDTVHIPMFEVKRLLGHALSEDEQFAIDTGKPTAIDAQSFFTMINRLHHGRDNILLCICNSGRRSLYAAQLLRSMGYGKALSVAGGFQAWKLLQNAAPKA